MFTLHAFGDWSRDAVTVTWTGGTHRVPPDVEALVEQAWHRAARPNVQLFDGPMCRLESWSATPQRFAMALSRTSYKEFVGTNLTRAGDLVDRYGTGALANPVGVSVALRTADGFLLLGRRNANVAYYPGRVHPFAGAMEPREGADPFATVARELEEELALPATATADVRLIGLVADDSIRQPELIFAADTVRTRDEVATALDAAEHDGLYAVRTTPDALVAVSREPQFTPVALATILLWGRRAHGDEWYPARSRGL